MVASDKRRWEQRASVSIKPNPSARYSHCPEHRHGGCSMSSMLLRRAGCNRSVFERSVMDAADFEIFWFRVATGSAVGARQKCRRVWDSNRRHGLHCLKTEPLVGGLQIARSRQQLKGCSSLARVDAGSVCVKQTREVSPHSVQQMQQGYGLDSCRLQSSAATRAVTSPPPTSDLRTLPVLRSGHCPPVSPCQLSCIALNNQPAERPQTSRSHARHRVSNPRQHLGPDMAAQPIDFRHLRFLL